MLKNGYTPVPPGKMAAVVTYLEMLERPSRQPCYPPPGLSVRRVKDVSPGWYRDLFRSVGQDWLWFSRLGMADEQLKSILRDEHVDIFCLEFEGIAKGLLELDRRDHPDIELAFFGLTADLIGRGAGRYLMDFAIGQAWSHQPRRFHVHTCTLDHPRALEFYLRAGFTAYKRAIEISDDPRLTGHLPLDAAQRVPVI
jgi:GNAT superfamily N-acetyltransferase